MCVCVPTKGFIYTLRTVTTALRLAPPPTVLNSNMAILGAGATQTVRSCTEKRPSSRPLLLPNRPLSAVYMPYLLSYCARAAVAPRSCRCWPSLALACAALVSCAMGRGEWLCCCCICCCCCLLVCVSAQMLPVLLLPCLLRAPPAAAPPPFSVSFFQINCVDKRKVLINARAANKGSKEGSNKKLLPFPTLLAA